jgi:hypothetical protein
VTAFESWYATNIAPTLPADIPPQFVNAAKESLAACWNAAVEECRRWLSAPHDKTNETELMAQHLTFRSHGMGTEPKGS